MADSSNPPDRRHSALLAAAQRAEEDPDLVRERDAFTTKAIDWLIAQWGPRHPCPFCANTEWTVGEDLVELPLGGLTDVYASFAVTCDRCGFTALIDAVHAGLPTGEETGEP